MKNTPANLFLTLKDFMGDLMHGKCNGLIMMHFQKGLQNFRLLYSFFYNHRNPCFLKSKAESSVFLMVFLSGSFSSVFSLSVRCFQNRQDSKE